jgi:hypothetical protein
LKASRSEWFDLQCKKEAVTAGFFGWIVLSGFLCFVGLVSYFVNQSGGGDEAAQQMWALARDSGHIRTVSYAREDHPLRSPSPARNRPLRFCVGSLSVGMAVGSIKKFCRFRNTLRVSATYRVRGHIVLSISDPQQRWRAPRVRPAEWIGSG